MQQACWVCIFIYWTCFSQTNFPLYLVLLIAKLIIFYL